MARFLAATLISGRSAPTRSGTEPGRAISSPTSIRRIATAWRARFSAVGRSRQGFPEHFGTISPKFSARRWWAAEVSVFARHCAGWRIFDGVAAGTAVKADDDPGGFIAFALNLIGINPASKNHESEG